jgi:hypothetical protein
VCEPAARDDELAASVLDGPTYQRMTLQNLDSLANALNHEQRTFGIVLR